MSSRTRGRTDPARPEAITNGTRTAIQDRAPSEGSLAYHAADRWWSNRKCRIKANDSRFLGREEGSRSKNLRTVLGTVSRARKTVLGMFRIYDKSEALAAPANFLASSHRCAK